jgi:hypothetical protein
MVILSMIIARVTLDGLPYKYKLGCGSKKIIFLTVCCQWDSIGTLKSEGWAKKFE